MAENPNITVPVDAPAMKQIADSAKLALQAQKDLSLYRCIGVKIGTISKNPVEYGELVHIPAPSKMSARQEYIKEFGSKMENDSAGEWVVGCVALNLGRDD